MKKVLSIIVICISFFIVYFLQSNFFTWFNIAGIKPNLFIVLILFIGLNIGKRYGAIFGFIFGVILDLLSTQTIGLTGAVLAMMGVIAGYFNKNFSKDSRLTVIIMIVLSTIIYEVIMYIYRAVQLSTTMEILSFIKILSIETIFNIFIVTILYPLLKKLGFKLEEVFVKPKMLTRYF